MAVVEVEVVEEVVVVVVEEEEEEERTKKNLRGKSRSPAAHQQQQRKSIFKGESALVLRRCLDMRMEDRLFGSLIHIHFPSCCLC